MNKMQTELKVKANGNAMLGALMRGFKQRLEQKMAESRQTIQQQENELSQFSQAVRDRDSQMQTLSAKVEKKKFKTTQQKQLLASTKEQLNSLQSKMGLSEQEKKNSGHAFAQLQQQNQQLHDEKLQMQTSLKIKKSGN